MTDRDQERDKRIHEQILGKCWHEFYNPTKITFDCTKCHGGPWDFVEHSGPSYLSWEHYGPMLQKLEKEGRLDDLAMWYLDKNNMQDELDTMLNFKSVLLDPGRGCKIIDKFFNNKEP